MGTDTEIDRIESQHFKALDEQERLEKIAGEGGGQYMWAVWQTDPEYFGESLWNIYERKDEAERDAARLGRFRIERVMVIWNSKVVNGQ